MFNLLRTAGQDCLWMTGTILLAIFNSLLYCACTSVIRSQLCQPVFCGRTVVLVQVHLRPQQPPGEHSESPEEEQLHNLIPCARGLLQHLQCGRGVGFDS